MSKPTAKHPGKTAAQRRALDAIGCGNYSPIMAAATRDALLAAGAIEPCGVRVLGRGALAVSIPEYQMPIPVHMQWCSAVASDPAYQDER
jgi:hypothetical protein